MFWLFSFNVDLLRYFMPKIWNAIDPYSSYLFLDYFAYTFMIFRHGRFSSFKMHFKKLLHCSNIVISNNDPGRCIFKMFAVCLNWMFALRVSVRVYFGGDVFLPYLTLEPSSRFQFGFFVRNILFQTKIASDVDWLVSIMNDSY